MQKKFDGGGDKASRGCSGGGEVEKARQLILF